jgi:CHRD domain-containing protein
MRRTCLTLLTLSVVTLFASAALCDGTLATRLRGFDEVPAISSPGTALFNATLDEGAGTITWTMSYSHLNGNILQSHIHFAQKGVNGGIWVFLCSNLGNGPAGTQSCPPAPATISGTITAANIIGGAASQGIQVGDFGPIVRALKTGTTYANIHTDKYPGGEIRGQVNFTATP